MQIVEADSLLWCHPLLTYKISASLLLMLAQITQLSFQPTNDSSVLSIGSSVCSLSLDNILVRVKSELSHSWMSKLKCFLSGSHCDVLLTVFHWRRGTGTSAAVGDQNDSTANTTEMRATTTLVIRRLGGIAIFDRLVIWLTH